MNERSIRDFSCKRDGLTIRGRLYGDTSTPRGAVILSHGFTGNMNGLTEYAELLADMGLAAFAFDFCGGGLGCSSDGATQDMTVPTEKRDLMAVYEYVRAQPFVTDISMIGFSQGGFVAALAAAGLGAQRVRSLMLFFPALCIPDDARRGRMQNYEFDPEDIPDLLGDVPMRLGGEYARSVLEMDPYAEIQGYTGPTLLIHGTADAIVDISYARRARAVYPDCRYIEIVGAGHGFQGEDEAAARRALTDFVKESALGERP